MQIARNGEVLGQIEPSQILQAVSEGTVVPTDHYWIEGMENWELVQSLLSATPEARNSGDGVQEEHQTAQPESSRSNWRQDPATTKQIAFLNMLGVNVLESLTKGEASDLIEKHKDTPESYAFQFEQRMKIEEAERLRRSDFPSYHMRVDIDKKLAEIDQLQDKKAKSREQAADKASISKLLRQEKDLDRAEELERQLEAFEFDEIDLGDFKMDLSDLRNELKELRTIRSKFWRFTFRADWIDGDPECDLVDYGDAINKYHFEYGQHLKVPSLKEVREILSALDEQHPDWDKNAPEAFYARLVQRNPDAFLVRARR